MTTPEERPSTKPWWKEPPYALIGAVVTSTGLLVGVLLYPPQKPNATATMAAATSLTSPATAQEKPPVVRVVPEKKEEVAPPPPPPPAPTPMPATSEWKAEAGKLGFIVLFSGPNPVLYEAIMEYRGTRAAVQYKTVDGTERRWQGDWLYSSQPLNLNSEKLIISTSTSKTFKVN